jgi:outer membrane receptor protein involved in Fe transport
MYGGDWQTTDFGNGPQALDDPNSRQNVFARLAFDVTDHVNLYAQFMYGRSIVNMITTPVFEFGNLTINIDNPYLPGSVVQAMQKAGVTSLTGGTWNEALGGNPYDSDRMQFRYTLGGSGDFHLLGDEWKWNAFWNRNVSLFNQHEETVINANYTQALDAVAGPNGAPICRSTLTSPNNGCVPLDLLGTGVASPAAINYVQGWPTLDGRIIQDEFSGIVDGEPLHTWAGLVSVALGIEHRREAEDGTSDPLSKVNSYWDGNYKPVIGSYTVTEGFFETVVPLLKDSKFGKSLDLDGAVRSTSYSSSGAVTTWKIGGTYAPVDDFRLRVTDSRDIRAGNLSDLYQPGQTLTSTVLNPWLNNKNQTIFYTSIGNPQIAPERADTLDLGGVFQPRWVPGLSFSVDYWDIQLKDAISSIGLGDLINGCYDGQFPEFCQYITRDSSNNIINVDLKPVNLAAARARGIDYEASYSVPMGKGTLALRGLATRYLESSSNSGLPGAVTSDVVGNNGTLPFWRYLFEVTYATGPVTGVLTARGISAGTAFGNTYIQCSSNCPAYTALHPTIDNNQVDGALYFDLSLNYRFTDNFEGFLVVNNIANADPAPFPNSTGIGSEQWGVSQQFYDVLGRTFRAGVRFQF